jgi:hypothetical protein
MVARNPSCPTVWCSTARKDLSRTNILSEDFLCTPHIFNSHGDHIFGTTDFRDDTFLESDPGHAKQSGSSLGQLLLRDNMEVFKVRHDLPSNIFFLGIKTAQIGSPPENARGLQPQNIFLLCVKLCHFVSPGEKQS